MKDKTSRFFDNILIFISVSFLIVAVCCIFYFIVIGVATTVKDYKDVSDIELGYRKKGVEVHTDLQNTISDVSKIQTDSISKIDVLKMLGKLDK